VRILRVSFVLVTLACPSLSAGTSQEPVTSDRHAERLASAQELLRDGRIKKGVNEFQKLLRLGEAEQVLSAARELLSEMPAGRGADGARTILCRARAERFPRRSPLAPMMVGGNVQKPEAIFHPLPHYTSPSPRGAAIVRSIIDEEGCVTVVEVPEGTDTLTGPLVDAVRRWVYRPATLNGKPVAVYFNVTVQMH